VGSAKSFLFPKKEEKVLEKPNESEIPEKGFVT
jgi:hypothetical protein